MFEQLLEEKGCADVHNSPDVLELFSILDDNSKLLITDVGGLRTFLSKCTKFSFDKRNRNVVYLTSQEAYYELCKDNVRQSKSIIAPPECDDPLFVKTLDSKPVIDDDTQLDSKPAADKVSVKSETSIPQNDNCQPESLNQHNETHVKGTPNKCESENQIEEIKCDKTYIDTSRKTKHKMYRIENIDVHGSLENPETVQQVTDIILDKMKTLHNTDNSSGPDFITINELKDNKKTKGHKGKQTDFEQKPAIQLTMKKKDNTLRNNRREDLLKKKEELLRRKKNIPEESDEAKQKKHRCLDGIGGIKKICSNCTEVVIDDFLCLCTDPKKYEIEKQRKDPAYFGLGIFRTSLPPHGGEPPRYRKNSGVQIVELNSQDATKLEKELAAKKGNKKSADSNQEKTKAKSTNKVSVEQKDVTKDVESSSSIPLCVGEVGVQTIDFLKEERVDFKHKNDILLETNRRFIEELKMYKEKYESVQDDLQKHKFKYSTSTNQLQSELDESKKTIEVGLTLELIL